MANNIVTDILFGAWDRFTEPSTYASAGGALAVFAFFSENRDFLDYLAERPMAAICLGCFALGVALREKKS